MTFPALRQVRRVAGLVLFFWLHPPAQAEVFAGFASAWSAKDTQLQSAYWVFHAIDWRQTRYIAKHPNEFHERNPLLGRHPDSAEVDRFFVLTGLLHYGIVRALAPEYRAGFQQITLLLKVGVVANNYQLGVKIGF